MRRYGRRDFSSVVDAQLTFAAGVVGVLAAAVASVAPAVSLYWILIG